MTHRRRSHVFRSRCRTRLGESHDDYRCSACGPVIYPAPDLEAAKAWWTALLGVGLYFDEALYVGFNVGGYELGLLPTADPADGALTY